MIDHIGLRTAQFDVMTAFYEQALAPLGIKKLMTYEGGAGFGRDAPVLWIGTSSEPRSSLHLALSSSDKSAIRAFHAAALKAGRRTTARQGHATTRRTITPPSLSTPTATTSRPSATAPESAVLAGRTLFAGNRQFLPNSRGPALLFRNGAGSARAGAYFEAPERLGRGAGGYEPPE